MKFPIEELTSSRDLLSEVLDCIDTSHTESFYEMTPAYEELYSRFSYWVHHLISVFPEKEKVTRSERINVIFNVVIGIVILLGVLFTLFRVLGGS